MGKNAFHRTIWNYGLIIIATGVAIIYWRIGSIELSDISVRLITFFLFIGYGIFAQYFINRMAAKFLSLSLTDHFTGLYNRRGFLSIAEKQIKIAERTKKGSVLLLIADLDKLKIINDKLGYKKGDAALIEVASILRKVFRKPDIIARIGGDEFAVLGIAAKKSDIGAFEGRLHKEVDIHNDYENREYTISLSIGTACSAPEDHYSIDELMSIAEQHLDGHIR